jgi:hypothetical protein
MATPAMRQPLIAIQALSGVLTDRMADNGTRMLP